MPAFAVIQPNGLFARFSTIVDDFTHYNMTRSEAWDYFQQEGGNDCADGKLERAHSEPGRFKEAIKDIRRVHGKERADEAKKQCSEKLVMTGKRIGLTDLQCQIVENTLTQPVITAAMMLNMIQKMELIGTDLNTAIWDNEAMTFIKGRK